MSVSPVGFAGDYRRTRHDPATPAQLSDLLSLIGYEVTAERVSQWRTEWRVAAEVYAVNVHLRASDNIQRRCPRPEWLPEPWQGKLGDNGPTGTVLR